jgi:hypothetical protein
MEFGDNYHSGAKPPHSIGSAVLIYALLEKLI